MKFKTREIKGSFEELLKKFKPDSKFSTPEKTWEIYREALIEGDFELVEKCFTPDNSADHVEIVKRLGKQKAKELALKMRPIEKIFEEGGSAKYRILREQQISEEPTDITYYIYFRNIFGEWKIEDF